MKKLICIFLFALLPLAHLSATETIHLTKKDTSKRDPIIFSLGGGFIYTSLNFFKNYQEQTYYRGYGGRFMVQFTDRFRVSVNMEQVESINILPIWRNVTNTFYDLDAHWLMHFSNKRSKAYFIMGASMQSWQGFYMGVNDLNWWRLNIPLNSNYHTIYYGCTLGMGAEIHIVGPLNIYGEFRFRVSKTDVGTGLSDVLYSGGLKLDLFGIKPRTAPHHKHSILKFHDKYHWF